MADTRLRHPEREQGQPTSDRVPPRRRGGQELPDNVQDRPEQNAGYDDAARGGPAGTPTDDFVVDSVEDDSPEERAIRKA